MVAVAVDVTVTVAVAVTGAATVTAPVTVAGAVAVAGVGVKGGVGAAPLSRHNSLDSEPQVVGGGGWMHGGDDGRRVRGGWRSGS